MGEPVSIVLFDLGGVLIEVAGVPMMLELTGMTEPGALWRRWLECPWVRRFESGQCAAADFAAGLVSEWELPIRPTEFLREFSQWPTGPFDGAEELVVAVKARTKTGCLSNTNELHWYDSVASWPILNHFDHQFTSFELGLLKPDPAIFEHVATSLSVEPGRILFLDDNLINVESAAAAGFRAVHAVGVEEARTALAMAGLVQPI